MKLTRKIKIFCLMLAAATVLMTAVPALSWDGRHRRHYRSYYRPYYHGYYSRPYYSPYYSYYDSYYDPYYRPYYRPYFFGFPGFSFYIGP